MINSLARSISFHQPLAHPRLGADEIVMHGHASLGPIEPQIGLDRPRDLDRLRGAGIIVAPSTVESVHLASLEKLAAALGCDPGYLIVKSGK